MAEASVKLHSMKKLLVLMGVFIAIVLAVVGGTVLWVRSSLDTPKVHDRSETYIVIERGTTPGQIVAKLAAEGILESATPTLVYLKTFGNPAGEGGFMLFADDSVRWVSSDIDPKVLDALGTRSGGEVTGF